MVFGRVSTIAWRGWFAPTIFPHSMNDEIGRPGAIFPYSGRKRPHITLEVLGL